MNPNYVWHLEDGLDLYAEPEDPRYPQVCFDESPVQLTSETRQPLPAQPGQPVRYDTEYKREGTVNLFLFVQPLRGWRHANVTPQRTKADFAEQMRRLVDEYFPTAERIRLVLDNLNTHTPAALYHVLPPAKARRIIRKLEFHYTPQAWQLAQHGRMQVGRTGRSVPGSPHPQFGRLAPRDRGLAGATQRAPDPATMLWTPHL